MNEKFVPNHLHILIKGYIFNPPVKEETLNSFFLQLVENVRMKVIAGPTSVYVNEPGNEGTTGTVTLATSHASMHVWDNISPALFQFDLYSCCEFSPEEIIKTIDEFFKIESCNYWFIDRNGSGFKLIKSEYL
jgi:S-adenosylmethionine/arginine decarboxylase-like enzyme